MVLLGYGLCWPFLPSISLLVNLWAPHPKGSASGNTVFPLCIVGIALEHLLCAGPLTLFWEDSVSKGSVVLTAACMAHLWVFLHLAGSRSMFVVILISILIHVSPRFIQMNLIKSLSLIFILCKKFTERGTLDTHHLDSDYNIVLCAPITHCRLSFPQLEYFGKFEMVLLVIL